MNHLHGDTFASADGCYECTCQHGCLECENRICGQFDLCILDVAVKCFCMSINLTEMGFMRAFKCTKGARIVNFTTVFLKLSVHVKRK